MKNRKIFKQQLLDQKIGKQKHIEDIEEFHRPVIGKLQVVDDKQDELIAELGRNQRAIAAATPIPQPAIQAPHRANLSYKPAVIDMSILH